MTDLQRRALDQLVASLLAEPDTPVDAGWRRAANLLQSSRPDATARLLRRWVTTQVAAAGAPPSALEPGPCPAEAAVVPAAGAVPATATSPVRQAATLAVGVGAGVVGGGLVLAGLDALLGDDADLLDDLS